MPSALDLVLSDFVIPRPRKTSEILPMPWTVTPLAARRSSSIPSGGGTAKSLRFAVRV